MDNTNNIPSVVVPIDENSMDTSIDTSDNNEVTTHDEDDDQNQDDQNQDEQNQIDPNAPIRWTHVQDLSNVPIWARFDIEEEENS